MLKKRVLQGYYRVWGFLSAQMGTSLHWVPF